MVITLKDGSKKEYAELIESGCRYDGRTDSDI